jgi:hypothetical protein
MGDEGFWVGTVEQGVFVFVFFVVILLWRRV